MCAEGWSYPVGEETPDSHDGDDGDDEGKMGDGDGDGDAEVQEKGMWAGSDMKKISRETRPMSAAPAADRDRALILPSRR